MAKRYVNKGLFDRFNFCAIRTAYASPSYLAVIPMQDVLGLGAKGRMNVPSTLGGNWSWRLQKQRLKAKDAARLKDLAEIYMRDRSDADNK